ncbi:MAG: prepilin-type N-terminal cleavage/methylation domain-containing protein [Candidatus Nomurabacteria bacterium]|nr:prepilin-type N-terminal cleavage/methylation domain-containing protein [Candidatus Nomurabacteria bacterium]
MYFFNKQKNKAASATGRARMTRSDGFTLIEVMVSITIFAIVMTVGLAALLSINRSYQKAQTERTITDNLSSALEAISRQMRVGTSFHCGGGAYEIPRDCATGDSIVAFEAFDGDLLDMDDQVVYQFEEVSLIGGGSYGQIQRSLDSGRNFVGVTGRNINIENFDVRIIGAESSTDGVQPFAIITIRGKYTIGQLESDFVIQTSVAQRQLDLPSGFGS